MSARLFWMGWLFHLKTLTNSLFFVLVSVLQPIIFASIAFFMVESGSRSGTLLYVALGAGLMGIWSATLFGSGGAGPTVVEAMDRWRDRIWYVHFKDADLELARRSREEGWDYFQALRAGLFSELGTGDVDFPAVVRWLRDHGYDGWIVVEQDVLPSLGTPLASAQRNREYLARLGL